MKTETRFYVSNYIINVGSPILILTTWEISDVFKSEGFAFLGQQTSQPFLDSLIFYSPKIDDSTFDEFMGSEVKSWGNKVFHSIYNKYRSDILLVDKNDYTIEFVESSKNVLFEIAKKSLNDLITIKNSTSSEGLKALIKPYTLINIDKSDTEDSDK